MKGPLHSVKGGNRQIPVRACTAASQIVPSAVTVVELLEDGKFRLHTAEAAADFNYVILSVPLQQFGSNVLFKGFPDFFRPSDWIGSYQRTVATFVEGSLNYSFFGSETRLDNVFNVERDSTWSSVGKLADVFGDAASGHPVYKVFSAAPLAPALLAEMFLQTHATAQVDWKAYPNYAGPPIHPPPFVLYGNLSYLNAVEWIGSAMEMSLIAAKNLALAIANEISGLHPLYCSAPEKKKSELWNFDFFSKFSFKNLFWFFF